MGAFCLSIVVVALMSNIGISTFIDTPTIANATHQYFSNSGGGLFQLDEILCGTEYCHISCDSSNSYGCYQLTVNASISDTLIVECQTDKICEQLTINGPKMNLYVYCTEEQSCIDAIINAQTTTNVNLFCNYSLASSSTYGTCNDLILNASLALSANIDCIGDYSCFNGQYYLDYTESVIVNVDGKHSMYGTRLYADNMKYPFDLHCNYQACYGMWIYAQYATSPVTITCDSGYSSCYAMRVYAADMQASVTVNCGSSSSCNLAQFFCPILYNCNINCEAGNACSNTRIITPSNRYEMLNLKCNSTFSNACSSTTMYCSGNPSVVVSTLSWDSTYSHAKCGNFECCLLFPDTIICSPDSNCLIDCNTQNCLNYIIDATLATSLTIDCSGTGCDAAKILCPTGDATSCTINCVGGSCTYMYIKTGTNNIMNSFNLNCGYSSGCQWSTVILQSLSIADVSITCTRLYTCERATFDIRSSITNLFSLLCTNAYSCEQTDLAITSLSITDMVLECSWIRACWTSTFRTFNIQTTITNEFNFTCSSTGCESMNIDVPSTVNKLLWSCVDDGSCTSAEMTLGNGIINSYELFCNTSSCENIEIISADSVIYDLNVDCIWCSGMNINAKISNSAYFSCAASKACEQSNINIESTTANVNVNIDCINSPYTTSQFLGACWSSNWYLQGYMDTNKNNNFTLQCSRYDCRQADFHVYDFYNADVGCINQRSCQQAIINTTSTDNLNLNCADYYACSFVSTYCPYQEENSCKVTCAALTQSCYYMQINVPSYYTYNYLDLQCPSHDTYPTSNICSNIDFVCDAKKNQTQYVWNSNITDYQCSVSGILHCCPFFEGTNKIQCANNQICNIDCIGSNNNCTSVLIDATTATYLTINCDENNCHKSVIHCPVGGCVINCYGNQSCSDAQIVYNGKLTDNGVVSINCTGYFSCYYTDFVVQYANDVRLTAIGHYSFYYGMLNAGDAGSVTISLSSVWGNAATRYADYYLPQNVIIKCYGTGCYYLNNIYRGSNNGAFGLQFYMEPSNECECVAGCINEFQLICDLGIDYFNSSSGCGNDNDCGCKNVMRNVQYSGNQTQNCTGRPTISPSENPTKTPSINPSMNPSTIPSVNPSDIPSVNPSDIPSVNPSMMPSETPIAPSDTQTDAPSYVLVTSTPATQPPDSVESAKYISLSCAILYVYFCIVVAM